MKRPCLKSVFDMCTFLPAVCDDLVHKGGICFGVMTSIFSENELAYFAYLRCKNKNVNNIMTCLNQKCHFI